MIWKHDVNEPNQFKSFKQYLNDRCKINLDTEDLSKSTKFLDLMISIKKGKFITKTYQKSMNIFLCIPGHSDQPLILREASLPTY